MVLFLTRSYFPDGTNGKLECEGTLVCYTIELPWKQNENRVSCIPEGKYLLRKRFSKRYQWHFEIIDVPNRKLILFHPANYALQELQGCIAPVSKISGSGIGIQSRKAFKNMFSFIMRKIDKNEEVTLIIRS